MSDAILKSDSDTISPSVRVFISYASDDNAIAETLRNQLVNFDLNRVDAFHDSNDLRAGENWKDTILFKLTQADWFIGVFTGKQRIAFSYPGYEVGIFESVHRTTLNDPNDKSQRILCLYDTTNFPNIFNAHQNRRVLIPQRLPSTDAEWHALIDASELMQFFSEFTDYCIDKLHVKTSTDYYNRARERNFESAKTVLEEFYKSQQTNVEKQIFTQKRLTLKIKGNFLSQTSDARMPDDARVDADGESLAIIGGRSKRNATGQEVSYHWKELIESLLPRGQEKLPWAEQINSVILSELDHSRPFENYMAFTGADGNTYRIILARYKLYRNGSQKYYIQLIPTTPRRLSDDSKLEPIMAALVLGSQVRLLFFEDREKSYRKQIFTERDDKLAEILQQLQIDVDKLLRDAAEHGLANIVEVKKFFNNKRDAIVDRFFNQWTKYKGALFEQINEYLRHPSGDQRKKVELAYATFDREVGPANADFISMTIDRYRDLLDRGE
jgi:hypothetical protein